MCTTVLKTTWTCNVGHELIYEQDLGDPADAEQVPFIIVDIRYGGCREETAHGRCGRRCEIKREEYET